MRLSTGKSGNGRQSAGGPADTEKSASGAENASLSRSVRILDVIADRFPTFEKRTQIRQAPAVIRRQTQKTRCKPGNKFPVVAASAFLYHLTVPSFNTAKPRCFRGKRIPAGRGKGLSKAKNCLYSLLPGRLILRGVSRKNSSLLRTI